MSMEEPNFVLKAIKKFTGAFGMVLVTFLVLVLLASQGVRDQVLLSLFDGTFWPSGMVVLVVAGAVAMDFNRVNHDTKRQLFKDSQTEKDLIAYKKLLDSKGPEKLGQPKELEAAKGPEEFEKPQVLEETKEPVKDGEDAPRIG